MYQISANLVHRELRNATFEGKKIATSIKRPDSGCDALNSSSLVHAVSHDLKLKGRVLVISKRGICESGFGVFFLQKLRFSALC